MSIRISSLCSNVVWIVSLNDDAVVKDRLTGNVQDISYFVCYLKSNFKNATLDAVSLSRYSLSSKRCISRLFRLFVQHKHLILAPPYMQSNSLF